MLELEEWEDAGRRAVEIALRKIGRTHGVFGSITPTSPFFEEPLIPEELLDEAKETITGFFWLEGCFRGIARVELTHIPRQGWTHATVELQIEQERFQVSVNLAPSK